MNLDYDHENTRVMVSEDQVRSEILSHWGCNGDPDKYLKDTLNLDPKTELRESDWIYFYQHFVDPNTPMPKTSGRVSRWLFGDDNEPLPAPTPARASFCQVRDGLRVYTANLPRSLLPLSVGMWMNECGNRR